MFTGTCPACGSEILCPPDCPIGVPYNRLRERSVRVLKDSEGEEYLHVGDLTLLMQAHVDLIKVSNWTNPINAVVVGALASMGALAISASNPDSPLRVMADEIDTAVPDTVPTDWSLTSPVKENTDD